MLLLTDIQYLHQSLLNVWKCKKKKNRSIIPLMFIKSTEYFYCKEHTFKAHQSFHICFVSTKSDCQFHFHRILELHKGKKGGRTMFTGHRAHFKSSATVKALWVCRLGKPSKGALSDRGRPSLAGTGTSNEAVRELRGSSQVPYVALVALVVSSE